MKKNILIGSVVALLISVSAIPALAFDRTGPKGSALFKDLNLTAAQQQKIAEIRKNMRNDPQWTQMRNDRKELRTLKSQKPVDQTKVDAKMKEIKDLRAQMRSRRQSEFDQLKSVLTPEQLAKLNADFKNRPAGQRQFGKRHHFEGNREQTEG